MSRRLLGLSLAITLTACGGCSTNPVTGDRELSLVSEGQEIQMGEQYAKEVVASMGLVDDPALQQYVSTLGKQLAAESERPELPWEFYVIDDAAVNAFAIPGGKIFVTRGMLTHMTDEAELVGVLGHEIGHVTARHSVQQMSRQQLASLGLGIGTILSEDIAKYGQLASTGLSVLFLKYGRDDERQADELGFKYMVREGYDPRAMVDMFDILRRVSGEGGRVPSFLSTHPYPEERIQITQQRLDTFSLNPATLERDEQQYLQRIDGLAFGANPRQGFFRGTDFYHPELRFAIEFPDGWQTQNTNQAVLAGSPQNDAIMQLTLAQGSPAQAAQQFFAQQGLQSQNVGNTQINGMPAVSGLFQAQTEQGVVQGLAAFLEYGGRTYMLMGYTPANRYGNYDQAFRSAIASFSRVTDPSVLNAQPARVDIVRLPSAMTFGQFMERYPSTAPAEEVAIINGVEGTGTQLAAGRMMKRVVGG